MISDSVEPIDDLLLKIENIEPDLILNVLNPRETYFEHANGNVLQVLSPIIDLYFEKKGGSMLKEIKIYSARDLILVVMVSIH